MMRFICVLLLLFYAVLFTGCATRPPSPMFFMETYHRKEISDDRSNWGFSLIANLPSIYTYEHEPKKLKDVNIYEYEIPIDFSFQYWRSVKSHFVWGVGGFLGDGFIYAGFAWDYLGVMAWSDFGSLIVMLPTFGFFVPAFGFSTVEQIHISKDISLGISQHVEYNWFVSSYETNYYQEFAGGLYLLKRRGEGKKTIGLELRYGKVFSEIYKLDGSHHLAIMLSFI